VGEFVDEDEARLEREQGFGFFAAMGFDEADEEGGAVE